MATRFHVLLVSQEMSFEDKEECYHIFLCVNSCVFGSMENVGVLGLPKRNTLSEKEQSAPQN